MIILLPSFPRSGNTYFRIVANVLYGTKSGSVYDRSDVAWTSDEASREIASLVGHLPPSEWQTSNAVTLLKTHELPDAGDARPAIYLVRDGREVLVSYAHYVLAHFPDQHPGKGFAEVLAVLVQSKDHFGGWSRNVGDWLGRSAPTAVVRYEELVTDPAGTCLHAFAQLGVQRPEPKDELPSFARLHELLPTVFRSGKTGNWHVEMPAAVEDLFWQCHGKAMTRLGYKR
jgi:Sulfotransferase domain